MGRFDQQNDANTYETSGILVIETMGDMDLYSALKIKEYFNSLVAAGKTRFIIDLLKTKYVDSSGLGVLIYMQTTAMNKQNIHIRFVNIAPQIFKVLKLTHLDNMFQIAENLETGINDINAIDPDGTGASAGVEDNKADDRSNVSAAPGEKKKGKRKSASKLKQQERDLPPELEISDQPVARELILDENSPLFIKKGLNFKKMRLGINKIQKAVAVVLLKAPVQPGELDELQRQIYEIIKNAVKHGNRGKWWRSVKIWYAITPGYAHLIVEDNGSGFQQLEEWNEFYKLRLEAEQANDPREKKKYQSFYTADSDTTDRGSAFFSAIEYWNEGIVFNNKRNAVAVKRFFE